VIPCPTKGCEAKLADDAVVCPDCGRDPRGKNKTRAAAQDATRFQCAYELNGVRCRYLGTFASSVHGAERWYCFGHWRNSTGAVAQLTAEESERFNHGGDYSAAEIIAATLTAYLEADFRPTAAELQVQREIPRPTHGVGTWWAERIVRLDDLGHPLPAISVRIAKEVLARVENRTRR